MGNAIDDTLCNIDQGRRKTTKVSSFTVGNGPNKGVKITVNGMKDGVPLDKRRPKRSRKTICTVSFVILQMISVIKAR